MAANTGRRAAATGILSQRMAMRPTLRGPGSGISQVAAGFGAVLGVGTFLLMLPFASESGEWVPLKTALFTSTSAVCVTGLIVADTHVHWSGFGHVVIMALIQIGGLGYMLGTSVVFWVVGRQMGLRDRNMVRLYYGAPSMAETFSFAKAVGLFSLVFEVAGVAVLSAAFLLDGTPAGQSLWWGLFHSISAFNNAGFSITGADMAPYAANPLVLLTFTVLIVAGAVGFLPIVTFMRRRSFRRLPLDSKLIFVTSGSLLAAGALFVGIAEWRNDDTLGGIEARHRPVAALFHSVNRTAGFSVVDVPAMTDESKVSTMGLMFVGGAAGSAAGGLKVAAFSLLLAMMVATLRGREVVTAFGRRIPPLVIQQATTLALYYLAMVFVCTLALTLTSELEFVDVVFEAVSAVGTVGFSAGGTLSFGGAGHAVLIVAMLFGRFSPLILILYMSQPRRKHRYHYPSDSLRLG
jgi:trk system potassium uptake protein TrkH